jgi:hypothetical protein
MPHQVRQTKVAGVAKVAIEMQIINFAESFAVHNSLVFLRDIKL